MLIKSKIILYFGIIIFGLILVNACSDDDSNVNEDIEENQSDIFPLNISNSWTYKLNVYPADDDIDTYREYVMKIIKKTTLNEQNYYNIEVNGSLEKNLYINKGDGHYFLNSSISKDSDILAYKYPCNLGDSWERLEKQIVYGNKSISTVMSLNKKVLVPYGEVECIEYNNEKRTFFSTKDTLYILEKTFLKPGLGIVNLSTFHKINFDGKYELYSSVKLVSALIK